MNQAMNDIDALSLPSYAQHNGHLARLQLGRDSG
jgi:hypothetical protein